MAGGTKKREITKRGDPGFVVVLEHESMDDAEDRLLQVYEFLLGLPDGPEICSEGEEST